MSDPVTARGLGATANLACLDATVSSTALTAVALVGLGLVVIAWRLRVAVAIEGHGTAWALAIVLTAVLCGLFLLVQVPLGCTSEPVVLSVIAALSPWLVAALVVRSGIAPPPSSLRTDELR